MHPFQYYVRFTFSTTFNPLCLQSTAAATTSHPFQVEALFPTPPRNASARGSQPLLDLRQYPEIDVVGTTVTQVGVGGREEGREGGDLHSREGLA